MSLHQLIYVSKASQPLGRSELVEILNTAKVNNATLDVTGSLFYNGGWFMQVLEGELSTLNNLYEKISRDRRHTLSRKIYCEPTDKRTFSLWTMNMTNLEEKTDDKHQELVQVLEDAKNDVAMQGRSPAVKLLGLFGA